MQRQYSGRSGCAFTPALRHAQGREELRFCGGCFERSKAEGGAEKVPSWRKDVPPRLKPHCKQSSCGMGKPVPLSKTDFFSTLGSPGYLEVSGKVSATAKTGWVIVYIPTLGAMRPRRRWGTPCSCLV